MRELTITIVATGEPALGKTRAINTMVASLGDQFEITAQYPKQDQLSGVETYTFKARLRS